MIIDCHVHIMNADNGHLSGLLRAADRAGVDRLCISSLCRRWVWYPTAPQLEEAADDVLAACGRYPDRFIGSVYVSAQHVEKSVELIERCVINGPCRIVKLWVSQFADDPRLDPIMERAIELDIPVLAHTFIKATGALPTESTYHHVIRQAQRHPRLKIWLAHYSARWEEAARVVRPYPNVCMDICGGEPEDGVVDCLLKHIGPERLFFGSDAPGRSFVVQMSKVLSADISEAQRRMILGDNIRRWIGV